jgi:hypothetical protein
MAHKLMTPENFYKKMKKIANYSDSVEAVHIWGDEALCKMLKDLGYGAGIRIFKELDKWYS